MAFLAPCKGDARNWQKLEEKDIMGALGKYGYCFLALVALIGGAAYFLIFGASIG